MGEKRGLAWAMTEVFTSLNFGIAVIAALVGYILFEFLQKSFYLSPSRLFPLQQSLPVLLR